MGDAATQYPWRCTWGKPVDDLLKKHAATLRKAAK